MASNGLKKNLKLVSMISMVLFSLTVAFVGTVAWFTTANSKKTEEALMKLSWDADAIDVTAELYRYDVNDREVKKIDVTKDTDLSLDSFDTFIRSNNAKKNNILKINGTFAAINDAIGFSRDIGFRAIINDTVVDDKFNEGGTYKDTVGYWYKKSSKDYICNNISNVIDFKMFIYSITQNKITTKLLGDKDFDATTKEDIYNSASEVFASMGDSSTFVINSLKNNSLSIQNTFDNVGQATNMVMYIQYEYNANLIDAFFAHNEFVTATEASTFNPEKGISVDFNKDIKYIEITSKSYLK